MLFKRRGNHRAAGRLRRKVWGVPVVGWIVGGIATTALAVAGFIVLMGAAGSISSGQGINMIWGPDGPNPSTLQGTATCDANYVGVDQLNIAITNALPGSACRYTLSARNMVDEGQARMNGFKLRSAGFADGDVRATVANCQQVAGAGGSQVSVQLTIWIDDINPGEALTFDPNLDGLEWAIPSHHDPANCAQTP